MLEKPALLVSLALALTGCDAKAEKADKAKASKGGATVEADSDEKGGEKRVEPADGSRVVVDPNGNLQVRGATIDGQ